MAIIVLDLDETLFDCKSELAKRIKEDHGIIVPEGAWLTDENTNGALSAIHEVGEYMATCELFPQLSMSLNHVVQEALDNKHQIHVCSHRGFHPDARKLTRRALDRYQLRFTREHYLCPREYPDKTEYLHKLFGGRPYSLIDDNPYGRSERPITASNVYLVDQPHNADIACQNRIRVVEIPSLIRHLCGMIYF